MLIACFGRVHIHPALKVLDFLYANSEESKLEFQYFVSIFNIFSKGYAIVSEFRFKLEHGAYFHYILIRPDASRAHAELSRRFEIGLK